MTAHNPNQNRLLAALPAPELDRLTAHLEPVTMMLGQILYQPGEQLQHAYFPTSAIVSLHYVMASGASAESAGVGNEGVVGVSLYMGGGGAMPSSAVCTSAGLAYRMGRRLLLEEFGRVDTLQSLLLRYAQGLITQLFQTAACNRHHSVEQQVCRWLLVNLDRIPSGHLVTTQELIASMLGVRREGVTQAAGRLQQAGIIQNRRGHISVIERRGLESRACECYQVVRKEMDRLLPGLAHGETGAGDRQWRTALRDQK